MIQTKPKSASLYPFHLLRKTFLLWVIYITCGMTDSVRGPTLLDLKDLINVEISEVATIFAFKSFGGFIGVIMVGLLLDRFKPSVQYLFLFITFFIKTIATSLLPHAPSLMLMQAVEFVFGLCHGSFHSVGNLLIIRIWAGSGQDCSPYVYAMHFFYAIGALMTPVIAKPFLREEASLNTTMINAEELEVGVSHIWTIKTLYPLISLIMLLPTPFLLYYFIQEQREENKFHKSSSKAEVSQLEDTGKFLSRSKTSALMMFAFIFYFTMAGIEHGFRSFTVVFSVNSELSLSRPEAADVLATFYVAFAAIRGLVIPLSTLVSAPTVLWSSSAVLLASTTLLSVWGQSSIEVLKTGVGLSGLGVGSMVAAGMLWLKELVPFNNKVTAMICFAARLSEQSYSMGIGHIIEDHPMYFLYVMSANILCIIICLAFMKIIAHK